MIVNNIVKRTGEIWKTDAETKILHIYKKQLWNQDKKE